MNNLSTDNAELRTVLLEKQKQNLLFAENWIVGQINGVDVIKALSYFTVQFLNHVTLKLMTEEKKSE